MFHARNLVMETYESMTIYLLVAAHLPDHQHPAVAAGVIPADEDCDGAMNQFWAPLIEGLPGWLPQLLWAALQTLRLTALSFLVAVPLGMVVVLLRLSPFQPLRWAAIAWIEVARGTPALVILFLIYFGLPSVFPVDQSQLAHGGRRRPRPAGRRHPRRDLPVGHRGDRPRPARGLADAGTDAAPDHGRRDRAAGLADRAAAGRKLCGRPAEGHVDRIDHRGARAHAARQGPGVDPASCRCSSMCLRPSSTS